MSAGEEPKADLIRLIDQDISKAEAIVDRAAEELEFGQYVIDLGRASKKVIRCHTPSNVDLQLVKNSWQSLSEHQDTILGNPQRASIAAASTSGTAVAYYMTEFTKRENIVPYVSLDNRTQAEDAIVELAQVIERQADKDNLLLLMGQYNLDKRASGHKSPADQLDEAWTAHQKPVTPTSATGCFIPMRQCVKAVIEELLRCRPMPEPASSWRAKVHSIVTQLAASGVGNRDIEDLANQCDSLIKELSRSKEEFYTREACRACLQRASLFLFGLLKSLDRSKMK